MAFAVWNPYVANAPKRSSGMQGSVDKFARHFCAKYPGMLEYIHSALGSSPSFSAEEVRALVTATGGGERELKDLYAGSEQKRGTYPILQLYDYCITLDYAVENLKSDQARAKGYTDLAESKEGLQNRYIPPDFRPAFYRRIRRGGLDPEGKQVTTEGQEIGSKQIYEYRTVPPNEYILPGPAAGLAAGTRAKTQYERCVEEAYILDFPSFNDIVALSQGLYRVFSLAGTPVWVPGGRAHVAAWINEDVANTVAYGPKATLVSQYVQNRYMRESAAHSIEVDAKCITAVGLAVAAANPVAQLGLGNGQRTDRGSYGGGAMGTLIWSGNNAGGYEYKVGDFAPWAVPGPGQNIRVPVTCDSYDLQATWQALAALPNVPGHGMALRHVLELAHSVRETNIDIALNQLYKQTQVMVWSTVKRIEQGRVADPLAVMDISARGVCPAGSVLTYQTYGPRRKLLVGDEAYIQTPSGKTLRPDVDANTRECNVGMPMEGDIPSFQSACLKDLRGWPETGGVAGAVGMAGRRRRRRYKAGVAARRRRRHRSRSLSARRHRRSRSRSLTARRKRRSRSRSRASVIAEGVGAGDGAAYARRRRRSRRSLSAGRRRRRRSHSARRRHRSRSRR